MQTKACGKVHPEGVPCCKPVMYETNCCFDKVYDHTGPHEHYDKPLDRGGVVTHRWEEHLQIVDLPYDAYRPWSEEDVEQAEAAQQKAMAG